MSLDGARAPFAVKLNFTDTNNVNEYEVCTIGLEMALRPRTKGKESGDIWGF